MEDQKLYTTQEVASQLGVGDSRIRNMIAAGQAKPLKQIGGTWMFTQSEVERLRTRPKSKGGRPKKNQQ